MEDHVAHVLRGVRIAPALVGDAVVELEQVDALPPQAAKTLLESARDGGGERGDGEVRHAHFRADERLHVQRADRAAEILL